MSQALKTKTPASQERRSRPRNAPGFASRRGQKLSIGLTKVELIEKYRYKVRLIAAKLARDLPASVDFEDLVSMGYIGLMDAADRFDPKRGVKFETYSEFRIRGAILDELRKQDWVPRSARDRARSVRDAKEELEARTGSRPTDKALSRALKMPLRKFQELVSNLGHQTLVNIEDMPESSELADSHESSPFQEAVRKEIKAVVDRVLNELPEQERTVLKCYYYRGLNLEEIATILDLTASRISQIHSRAVTNLRQLMKTDRLRGVEGMFLALMDE